MNSKSYSRTSTISGKKNHPMVARKNISNLPSYIMEYDISLSLNYQHTLTNGSIKNSTNNQEGSLMTFTDWVLFGQFKTFPSLR